MTEAGNGAAAWRFLVLICGGVVLSLTTWFSATAVVPELTVAWDLSVSGAAWMTNGVQLGFVCGALLSAGLNLPDLLRPERLMAGAALLAAAANLTLLVEPGQAGAIAARVLTGFALAGVYPPALKLMSTWFRKGRGLALGLLIGALTLGSALPHLFRGLGAALDWQTVVTTSSACSLAAALLFLFTLREGPYPFAAARLDPRQFGVVLRSRALMLANIGYFGHMWELYAMWGWFLAYAAAASPAALGGNPSLLTFLVVAAGVPGCILGGILSDRIGRSLTTAILMGLSGSSALAIGLAFDGPTWAFVTIALIWGLTIVGDSAQFSAAVTELADSRFVGSALALQLGLGFALTVLAIWLTPAVATWLGSWRWAFLVLVPGPLAGVTAMLLLRRHPDAQRMAQGRR
ncbi:MFS transporter [Plastorhodobacter daqingensis]|uniref:MFS transporter n=1 Tax=Plastorhodobacter daqingensis TaxID=1387281 RepID=A0ABW2UR64_9RHOB